MENQVNLQSSLNEVGEIVTQIFHFSHGNKRTVKNIITSSIRQGEFTKFENTKRTTYSVNPKNVDMFETFAQKQSKPNKPKQSKNL